MPDNKCQRYDVEFVDDKFTVYLTNEEPKSLSGIWQSGSLIRGGTWFVVDATSPQEAVQCCSVELGVPALGPGKPLYEGQCCYCGEEVLWESGVGVQLLLDGTREVFHNRCLFQAEKAKGRAGVA